MAVYPIKCYYNTGITGGDALDSIQLLESLFESHTFESVWLLQDRYRATVKINAPYDTVKNCDYCTIGNIAYHVVGVSMLNENVAQLSLECDYLTTAGIGNIEIVEGWCMRRNPTTDAIFDNDIPESFQPMEPLEIDLGVVVEPSTIATNDYRVVISTVKLDESQKLAEKYVDAETGELLVSVPQIPLATTPTIFSIGSGADRRQYVLPTGTAYNYNADIVQKGIQSVRSLGIDSCIVASYTIPAEYVGLGSNENPEHREIGGIDSTKVSQLPLEYTEATNKKVFTGQFMKYGILSLVTGESQEFEPEVIEHNGAVSWRLLSDPLPTGKPYAMPYYYRGAVNSRFYGNVGGGEWQKNTIEFAQGSGALVEYAQYARKMQRNIAIGGAALGAGVTLAALPAGAAATVAGGLSMIPQIGGMAASAATALTPAVGALGAVSMMPGGTNLIAGGITQAQNAVTDLGGRLTNFLLERKTREIMFRAPDIAFSPVGSMQNYFGNTFIEYRVRLSENDTKRFDKFLTANGYSVSEPLQASFMNTHTNFNYVMADNVRVRTRLGLAFDTAIAGQLQGGVRIWHTNPTNDKLYNNPVKGA